MVTRDDQRREILGRPHELDTVCRAVATAVQDGAVLVVRGDPGVGKSALLQHAVRQVDDDGWRVVRTDGTPGERVLPLAAVHKLQRPVPGDGAALTPPRRQILQGAFGSAQPTVDVYGVALACLDLLGAVAARGPVAVVVDDAHWLDPSSAQVLAFIARRLSPDRVLLLAATRSPGPDLFTDAGLPDLVLGPLDDATCQVLIDRAVPGLDPQVRSAVLSLAEGNPLAVLELPLSLGPQSGPQPGLRPAQELTAGREPQRLGADGPLPLTRRLERAFAGRVVELPPATRDVLLAAAVGDTTDLAEALAAAGLVAGAARTVADLDAAVDAGMATVHGGSVRFRHPLVAAAVAQVDTPGRRQAMHAALAAGLVAGGGCQRTWRQRRR